MIMLSSFLTGFRMKYARLLLELVTLSGSRYRRRGYRISTQTLRLDKRNTDSIDPQNRIFVGYLAKDRAGQFYEYAMIGRLHVRTMEGLI